MNIAEVEMDENLGTYRQLFLSDLFRNNDNPEKYKQLKTYGERFKFALDLIVEHSSVFFDSEYKHKISEHSIRLRKDGNKSFVDHEYYRAVGQYTESIMYAEDSSEELALAYANRSAGLFNLHKYSDCVDDIDRALNLEFPDKLKSKLYKRKGLCLIRLGKPGTESSFQEALVWLEKMDLSENELNRGRRELKELITSLCTISKPLPDEVEPQVPELVTRNAEIPSASDGVALKYSKERGRHLVATRKIKPGELVILEKPYCLKLLPKYVYTNCEYCLRVAWAMIPCKYCVHAAYCSETCKDKAWNEYHEIECPVVCMLRCFDTSDALWVSMRMTIMATQKGKEINALKEEIVNIDRNTDPRTRGFSEDGKFHSDKYRSIYTLPNNVDDCNPYQLFGGGLWAALTICALARESNLFGNKLELDTLATNPDVLFVGELMLKHIHISWIKTHCYGAAPRSSASEQGQALLALCGLTNHSCDVNTIRQWYGDQLALYAAQPINKGGEILDNFNIRYTTMSRVERQMILKRRNVLACECIPCKENWPLLSRCPSYKNQMLAQKNKKKLDRTLRQFSVRYHSLILEGPSENVPAMVKEVTNLIEILFEVVERPCVELGVSVVMLRDLYASADTVFDYVQIDPMYVLEIQCSAFYLFIKDSLSKK